MFFRWEGREWKATQRTTNPVIIKNIHCFSLIFFCCCRSASVPWHCLSTTWHPMLQSNSQIYDGNFHRHGGKLQWDENFQLEATWRKSRIPVGCWGIVWNVRRAAWKIRLLSFVKKFAVWEKKAGWLWVGVHVRSRRMLKRFSIFPLHKKFQSL